MNAVVKKSKWFWAWQDDREEAWLGEMSRQGLHLRHAGAFGQYTFEQGEPREYAYRLDFVANARKIPDYYQLFQDAGWEHVGYMGGWQYWRKEIVDGEVPEIFTDNTSKIQKYQRLIGYLIIFFPIYIIFLTNPSIRVGLEDGSWVSTVYEVLFFMFFVIVVTIAFSMLKIAQRISSLKGK